MPPRTARPAARQAATRSSRSSTAKLIDVVAGVSRPRSSAGSGTTSIVPAAPAPRITPIGAAPPASQEKAPEGPTAPAATGRRARTATNAAATAPSSSVKHTAWWRALESIGDHFADWVFESWRSYCLGSPSNGQKSGTFEHVFTTPGSVRYHCDFHPDMVGIVNVH